MEPLDKRTYKAACCVRDWINTIAYSLANNEYKKQLIRSSGSVAANYIEASESFSNKDFVYRIKLCRKEARESTLWLKLICINTDLQNKKREKLINEYTELVKIFSSIAKKNFG